MGFVRDYVRILRSGVFMHSAYAARNLDSRRRLPLALLHYLWRGEKAGHLADPFIDPELRDPEALTLTKLDRLRTQLGGKRRHDNLRAVLGKMVHVEIEIPARVACGAQAVGADCLRCIEDLQHRKLGG